MVPTEAERGPGGEHDADGQRLYDGRVCEPTQPKHAVLEAHHLHAHPQLPFLLGHDLAQEDHEREHRWTAPPVSEASKRECASAGERERNVCVYDGGR